MLSLLLCVPLCVSWKGSIKWHSVTTKHKSILTRNHSDQWKAKTVEMPDRKPAHSYQPLSPESTKLEFKRTTLRNLTWHMLKSCLKWPESFRSNERKLFIFSSDLRHLRSWLLVLNWCLVRGILWDMRERRCWSADLDTVHWTHWIQMLRKAYIQI